MGVGRGIREKGASMIDWDNQPLGELPDRQIAKRLGCCRQAVSSARARRGIPAYKREWSIEIGHRWGNSVVLRAHSKHTWLFWCRCDCGAERWVHLYQIVKGECGRCRSCHSRKINPAIDLVGRRFGKLVVLRRGETNESRRIKWVCRCDCGNETSVFGDNLRYGRTKSCGCMRGKYERKKK